MAWVWHRGRHVAVRGVSCRHQRFAASSARHGIVDLRSDTVTLPTATVRLGAYNAAVGDDVYNEDPTARRLEQRVAHLLGKEAGVLMPSATMANLAALAASVPQRGAAVLCGTNSHILRWEQEGASSLFGLPLRPVPSAKRHPGELCLDAIEAQLSSAEDIHVAKVGAVTVENAHAESAGRALSKDYVDALGSVCSQHDIPLHVDGARLANAAAVLAEMDRIPVAEALERLARSATTVSLCLSKGLGAPAGAVLVGDEKAMHTARRVRKLLGGGMRQVGVLAGAALTALDENLDRLAEDHKLAAALWDGLNSIPGVRPLPRHPDSTNMIIFALDAGAGADAQLVTGLKDRHDVLLGYGYEAGQLRAVVHRDITVEHVARTLDGIRQELGVEAAHTGASLAPGSREKVASWEVETNDVVLRWADGHSSRFPHVWLRDHCPQSTHATSLQRQVDTFFTPADTHPTDIAVEGDEVEIVWDTPVLLHSGAKVQSSRFSAKWLRQHCFSERARCERRIGADERGSFRQVLWGGHRDANKVLVISHAEWLGTSDGLRIGMQNLYTKGALIVRGTPTTMDGTRVAVERIGHPRASFYGTMWDTAPKAEGAVNDTAYSNMELKPHNDCCYMRDPPGLQVFNCAAKSPSGGETWLVDGFAVAEALREQDPEAFEFFATTPIPSHSIDHEHDVHFRAVAPIIGLDGPRGRVVSFRLNNDDRDVLDDLPAHAIAAFYRHLPKLLRLSRDPAYSCFVQLEVGDMLIVDNNRLMHGRTSFQGFRNLVGCYVDRDVYESRLRLLSDGPFA
eukprot:CAMPEP_0117563606 /NCGR_PEP_ID=MMETSP0784-20121206/55583_1 /TAXON_ID=39447 /ORGANISM="" /LENGTH=795 /DNA_ID=CAMNT_0005361261 /DNA_START=35 /DNA_END=2422 /DNA_ORIENTATION=+